MARATARIGISGKSLRGWSDESQITNPQEFHPQCRPEETFDPKSGSCIPTTNIKGAAPVGTLECPDGFILNHLGLCSPESPTAQAQMEVPFAPRKKDIPKKLRPKDKKALKPLDDHAQTKNRTSARDLLQQIREIK